MSNEARNEYLISIRDEYKKANRREKSVLLRHAILVTRLSRKRIIRLLNKEIIEGPRPKRGRKHRYDGPELLKHLCRLWLIMEKPCAKRLHILIPRLLPRYHQRYPGIAQETISQLISMSPATIDRLLKTARKERGLSLTKKPASRWYKFAVPIQPHDWNITAPGYAQADTVSHCGENGSGVFASTLTVTDIDSHWTEMRATLTKHHRGILSALRDIEKNLPFVLNTLKFDSGSEFMNFEVVSYCRGYGPSYGREKPIQVLRSRPYRKNDNCYVEQKNLTHVRKFIGYERIETLASVRMLDDLYKNYWCPFLNFFMPTFKLIRKERVGSKIKKTYEKPRTPYERLLASEAVGAEQTVKLREQYEALDPFELKEQLEEKLKLLFETIRNERKPGELLKQTA